MLTKMIDAQERVDLRRAFSLTIRSLRKKAGVAQERLALETETDRGYMSSLERGLHTPSLETIFKLLPILGVSFEGFAAEFTRSLKKVRRENNNKRPKV